MQFEWDEAKSQINRTKHGLDFEQARILFTSGLDYLEIHDEEHSEDEERFIAVGMLPLGLIVVAFIVPQDDVIRIVSAQGDQEGAAAFRSLCERET